MMHFNDLPDTNAPLKILIADEPESLARYASHLHGLRVITATTHYEAYEKYVRELPHIVVCEWLSKQINSDILFSKIRSHNGHRPQLAIISADSEWIKSKLPEDVIVWPKPFTAEEFKDNLSRLIDGSNEKSVKSSLLRIEDLFLPSVLLSLPDLTHLDMNSAYAELAGLPVPELMNKSWKQLWRAQSLEATAALHQMLSQHQSLHLPELHLHSVQKQPVYYNLAIQPVSMSAHQHAVLLQMVNVDNTVKARKELEANEKQLRTLANAVPQLVWIAEPSGNVIYYNDRVAEFAGAEKLADGKWKWQGMVHEEDQPGTFEAWAQAVATGTIYTKEHRVRMSNGTYRWHLSRGLPVKDEEGQVLHWYGTATDIHNLKEAENKARENETRFRSLAENSPDVITRHDHQLRYLYVNQKIREITGKEPASFIGHSYWEMGLPESLCRFFDQQLQKVFESKQLSALEYRMDEESNKVVHSRLVPEFDEKGNVVSVLVLSTDVTQQKSIEEELRRSENNFRTLTQSLPQLIWTTDENGKVDFLNQQWYDYTGSTPKQSLGDAWVQYIHKKDVEQVLTGWQTSLRDGQPVKVELRLRGKDGTYKWFFVAGSPVRNENGEITKWVGTVSNINERREMQLQLENLVKKRTQELERSNQDLEQFAHVTSHDLKEPVRKIKIFATRLEEKLGDQLAEEVRLYLAKIYKSTDRMNAMIEGVLSYSIINGTREKIEWVDLNQLFEDVESDLEMLIEQKSAMIKVATLPRIEGSRVLLYQLFYNLINNSLKFSRPHEATVISVVSSLQSVGDEEMVNIMIRDNGIGFDPEFAEAIFNAAYRPTASAKKDRLLRSPCLYINIKVICNIWKWMDEWI